MGDMVARWTRRSERSMFDTTRSTPRSDSDTRQGTDGHSPKRSGTPLRADTSKPSALVAAVRSASAHCAIIAGGYDAHHRPATPVSGAVETMRPEACLLSRPPNIVSLTVVGAPERQHRTTAEPDNRPRHIGISLVVNRCGRIFAVAPGASRGESRRQSG